MAPRLNNEGILYPLELELAFLDSLIQRFQHPGVHGGDHVDRRIPVFLAHTRPFFSPRKTHDETKSKSGASVRNPRKEQKAA